MDLSWLQLLPLEGVGPTNLAALNQRCLMLAGSIPSGQLTNQRLKPAFPTSFKFKVSDTDTFFGEMFVDQSAT